MNRKRQPRKLLFIPVQYVGLKCQTPRRSNSTLRISTPRKLCLKSLRMCDRYCSVISWGQNHSVFQPVPEINHLENGNMCGTSLSPCTANIKSATDWSPCPLVPCSVLNTSLSSDIQTRYTCDLTIKFLWDFPERIFMCLTYGIGWWLFFSPLVTAA